VVAIGPTAYENQYVNYRLKSEILLPLRRFSGKVIVDPEDEEEYVALNDEDVVAILTGAKNG